MNNIPQANEFTLPVDLLNLGLKCRDCGDKHVVYTAKIINNRFPLGTYCYPCLLKRCRATRRLVLNSMRDEYAIPMPMEWNLLGRLKVDLGLEKPSQIPSF